MAGPYDLVSVDGWDTLLRRTVDPERVRRHTAIHLQQRHGDVIAGPNDDLELLVSARAASELTVRSHWRSRGFDDECRLEEVLEHWLERVLDPLEDAASRAEILDDLVQAELAFEASSAQLEHPVVVALADFEGDLALISDSHVGAARLLDLLRRLGWQRPFAHVYVSCEQRLAKRSGRLFGKVHDDLGVEPHRHLHIGRDPVADGEVPAALGIRTVHGANGADGTELRLGIRAPSVRARVSVTELARRVVEDVPAPRGWKDRERELFELGKRHSIAFVAFVYATIEEASRRGHSRVHYFTREGVFFKAIHDALARHAPLGAPMPEGELLEVSRLATFGPSLPELDAHNLMRLWRLYASQSIGALFRSLDLDPRDFQDILSRCDIGAAIESPWKDERILALLADRAFVQRATAELVEKRVRLVAYLRARGIDGARPSVATVDIGWRGSIQDNLAHLFPATRFDGFYLGLHRFLNPQLPNVTKRAFYFDENDSRRGESPHVHPSVIEMLCNSATGSVLRYEDAAGTMRPVMENIEGEDRVWSDTTRFFQEGVLAVAPVWAESLRRHPQYASELRRVGMEHLMSIFVDPPRLLADGYFRLHHNEGFGLGRLVKMRARVPVSAATRGIFDRKARKRVVRELRATGWPQGALRISGFDPLVELYNRRILKLRKR